MDLLELLSASDVDGFNTQRGESRRLDFFAADLPGRKLAGVDLSGANLDKADLSETDLSDASLYKTSMTGIDGTRLSLARALAARLRLKEAWLEEADLTEAELSHADCKEAVLVKTKGESVRLVGVRLTEVEAREAHWPQADLVDAQLYKADFTGADLRRADLTDARADEAVFTNARLDACIASRLRAAGGVFAGASLMGARLDGANLQGADLTGVDLSAADLTGANLTDAILTGAKLRGAIFADAVLDGVDMAELDLEDVDLRGVDPNAVGLSDHQIEGLAGVGAHYDPDAPLVVDDPALARSGDAVAVLWLNADNELLTSVRWALLRQGQAPKLGVLPNSAEGVAAKLACPAADGFELLLLQERPGGVSVVRYPLSAEGEVGASSSQALGYGPAILPVLRSDETGSWLWGMARRGPTLVVHRLQGDEAVPVHSETVATARGFLGQHAPILVCKGGVVMAVGPKGAGAPLRAPDGFPPRIAGAAAHEDRVLGVWLEEAIDEDEPGGLRTAWMARRGSPTTEALTWSDAVVALDVLATPQGVWVGWIELSKRGPEVRTTRLPGEEGIMTVPLDEGFEPAGLRFAPGRLDDPENAPVACIWDAEGHLVVTDVDGRPIGTVSG